MRIQRTLLSHESRLRRWERTRTVGRRRFVGLAAFGWSLTMTSGIVLANAPVHGFSWGVVVAYGALTLLCGYGLGTYVWTRSEAVRRQSIAASGEPR
ncbi:MAG TPA: hypothetical protein VHG51_01275 [Longimicrobiaceae bacterium]|nr:hypothetical protein [Longimicrobiaceae bacterium]